MMAEGDGLAGKQLALRCGCRMGTSTKQCNHCTTKGGGSNSYHFWSALNLTCRLSRLTFFFEHCRHVKCCASLSLVPPKAEMTKDDEVFMCSAGVISAGWEWTCQDSRRERRDSWQENTVQMLSDNTLDKVLCEMATLGCHDIIQQGILDWLFRNDSVPLNWIFLDFSVSIAAESWTILPIFRLNSPPVNFEATNQSNNQKNHIPPMGFSTKIIGMNNWAIFSLFGMIRLPMK